MIARTITNVFTAVALSTFVYACAAEDANSLGGGYGTDPSGAAGANGGAAADGGEGSGPEGPACTDKGRSYPGLEEGMTLEGQSGGWPGRAEAGIGFDRGRLKPFEALRSEMVRVTGFRPAALTGDAFGEEASNATPPPHVEDGTPRTRTWFDEPRASALTVYVTTAAAFDVCQQYAGGRADMAAAPTAESASAVCASLAKTFWSRTATPEEVAACVQATTTSDAPAPADKWAWGCASVLTSANFLSY